MISIRRQRKEKKERYLELESKKLKAIQIKELFGKPDYNTRSQLYRLMKDKTDYQQQLGMMKELYVGGKRKCATGAMRIGKKV